MNLVNVISTSLDGLGRRIVKILRFGRDDVRESISVSQFGFDSNPIKNMKAIYSQTESVSNSVIIGYVNIDLIAEIGESRIFSTDENGSLQTYIHLKNNGDIHFGGQDGNLTRFQELESAFNELKSDHNELVQKWNAFCASYVPGSPTTVGLPPTLASSNVQPSSADISGAKIDKFKSL